MLFTRENLSPEKISPPGLMIIFGDSASLATFILAEFTIKNQVKYPPES
jgi:hypothetical protein